MNLSKRERYIAIAVAAALALLLIDYFVWTPFFAQLSLVSSQQPNARQQIDEANRLRARRVELNTIWTEMQRGGLNLDPSLADSQAVHGVVSWAEHSGIALSAFK